MKCSSRFGIVAFLSCSALVFSQSSLSSTGQKQEPQASDAIKTAAAEAAASRQGGQGAAQEWTNFSSAEGRFSILMPAKAVAGTFDLQTGSIKVMVHAFTALSQPIMVMCGYFDFPSPPQNPEKVFDGTRNGSIRNVHGTLLTEEKLAKDGYSGLSFPVNRIGERIRR